MVNLITPRIHWTVPLGPLGGIKALGGRPKSLGLSQKETPLGEQSSRSFVHIFPFAKRVLQAPGR